VFDASLARALIEHLLSIGFQMIDIGIVEFLVIKMIRACPTMSLYCLLALGGESVKSVTISKESGWYSLKLRQGCVPEDAKLLKPFRTLQELVGKFKKFDELSEQAKKNMAEKHIHYKNLYEEWLAGVVLCIPDHEQHTGVTLPNQAGPILEFIRDSNGTRLYGATFSLDRMAPFVAGAKLKYFLA
jgi:hypothetical protein